MKRNKRGQFAKNRKQPRDSYGRFSSKDRPPPNDKTLFRNKGGKFVGWPPNYAMLKDFDFREHGLVCRLAEDGRLFGNMALRLVKHSDLKSEPGRKTLFLDIALNVLDYFYPVEINGRTPVDLKRGKASRTAVKLHKDFARNFLLAPGWKKEMSLEKGNLIEYQRFDLPLERVESWIRETRLSC